MIKLYILNALKFPFKQLHDSVCLCLSKDLIIMSWYESLSICLFGNLLSLLDIYIHIFQQIWQVFAIWSFKYSLCPFLSSSETPTMFHGSLMLCSLLFSLFSPCCSDSIIFIVLSSSYLRVPLLHRSAFKFLQ